MVNVQLKGLQVVPFVMTVHLFISLKKLYLSYPIVVVVVVAIIKTAPQNIKNHVKVQY